MYKSDNLIGEWSGITFPYVNEVTDVTIIILATNGNDYFYAYKEMIVKPPQSFDLQTFPPYVELQDTVIPPTLDTILIVAGTIKSVHAQSLLDE